MPRLDFALLNPSAGAVVGRTVTVSGLARVVRANGGDLLDINIDNVKVQFGADGPVVGAVFSGGNWSSTTLLPASVLGGTPLTLTVILRGELARLQGDRHQAEASHHQALRLWDQSGQHVGVASSLEALGGLAADEGRAERAVRLLAASDAFWQGIDCSRPPADQAVYDANVTSAREALPPEAFAAAWEEGIGLSLTEAVALAAKGRGPRWRPTTGWASLTRAEHDVALLAAQGMTNAEIGQRLFISPRTAKAHLAHIFAKLGITSRRQLSRLEAVQEPQPVPR